MIDLYVYSFTEVKSQPSPNVSVELGTVHSLESALIEDQSHLGVLAQHTVGQHFLHKIYVKQFFIALHTLGYAA
jgi:hypothetical protein